MTLHETLRKEEPARKPRIRKNTRHLGDLYQIVSEQFDDIDSSIVGGYSWLQISEGLKSMREYSGRWRDNWHSSDVNAMYNFICKEREIKGVGIEPCATKN